MKFHSLLLSVLMLAGTAAAKPRVAVLNAQQAILETQDGKAASAALRNKFGPFASQVSAQQEEIDRLQQQLDQPERTVEETASLKARIAALTQRHRRNQEDLQVEVEQEQKRLLQDLAAKLLPVVEKYARKKHFDVVLDVSDPRTPVYWRAASTDITSEIVKQYELAHRQR